MKFGQFKSLALKKERAELNSKGIFLKSKSFHIKFLEKDENKAIFIIKKKIGNSPKRNKIKRQTRYLLANYKEFNEKKFYIMVIIKQEFNPYNFQEMKNEFCNIFQKILKTTNKK